MVFTPLIFPKVLSLNGTLDECLILYTLPNLPNKHVNFVGNRRTFKKMFTENNDFNAEFNNHAFQQLEDWRIAFDEGNNKVVLRTELCRAIQHPLMQTLPYCV